MVLAYYRHIIAQDRQILSLEKRQLTGIAFSNH
jgi:hypothetical protein